MDVEREPRLLLLMTTATYRAGAFLEAAHRVGVPVAVGSERPQALATRNPSGHLTLDFLDTAGSCRRIVESSRREPIGAVVAADDDGVVLAAMAASALGLRSNPVEAVSVARDKQRMREALEGAGVLSPSHRVVSTREDPWLAAREIDFPCVLKPVFLSGSRGVIRADGPADFVRAFERISAILNEPEVKAAGKHLGERVLVEDFIPGEEVALEGLLSDGRLRVLAIYDKPDPLDGPYFEETLYVTPSRKPSRVQRDVGACVQRAVAGMGLAHGPVHAEVRINARGCWIVEIAPRSIGGLCSRTLRFGANVSLEELILRHALGQPVDHLERERCAAGVMMIPVPGRGVLKDVRGRESAAAVPGIEEVRITVPLERELVPLPEASRYVGFIFARGDRAEGVERALRNAHARLHFEVEPRHG